MTTPNTPIYGDMDPQQFEAAVFGYGPDFDNRVRPLAPELSRSPATVLPLGHIALRGDNS